MYYQYMDSANRLLFRYDNTGHHKKLGLSTFPYHKHVSRDDNVVASDAMELHTVLQKIESLVDLP